MLPIGITFTPDKDPSLKNSVEMEYIDAIERHGGLPIPVLARNRDSWQDILKLVKGLVLSGGVDVDPYYFDEEPLLGCGQVTPERDKMEILLIKTALAKKLPILAICRGVQVLNIACGGDIYQDLTLKSGRQLEHMQQAPRSYPFHSISIREGTLLGRILGQKNKLRVNSFHHQAVKNPGNGLQVSAVAEDGVIEAIESTLHPFVLGVQWHAEALDAENRPAGGEIFEAFVRAAGKVERS